MTTLTHSSGVSLASPPSLEKPTIPSIIYGDIDMDKEERKLNPPEHVDITLPTLTCALPHSEMAATGTATTKQLICAPKDLVCFQPTYEVAKQVVSPVSQNALREISAIVWGVNGGMVRMPRCDSRSFNAKLWKMSHVATKLAGSKHIFRLSLATSIPPGVDTCAAGVDPATTPVRSHHDFPCMLHPMVLHSMSDNLVVLIVISRFGCGMPRVDIPEPGASHNLFTSVASAICDNTGTSPAVVHSSLSIRSAVDGERSPLSDVCGRDLSVPCLMSPFYAQGCNLRSIPLSDSKTLRCINATLYSSFTSLNELKSAFVFSATCF